MVEISDVAKLKIGYGNFVELKLRHRIREKTDRVWTIMNDE